MSAQHTPGPWWLQADGAGWYVECTPERGYSVAYIRSEVAEDDPDTPDAEKEANARLIAAAPDLLEALKELSRSFIGTYSDDQRSDDEINNHREHWERMARAAIAKATGEQA